MLVVQRCGLSEVQSPTLQCCRGQRRTLAPAMPGTGLPPVPCAARRVGFCSDICSVFALSSVDSTVRLSPGGSCCKGGPGAGRTGTPGGVDVARTPGGRGATRTPGGRGAARTPGGRMVLGPDVPVLSGPMPPGAGRMPFMISQATTSGELGSTAASVGEFGTSATTAITPGRGTCSGARALFSP
jgi:hypothetical protein